VAGGVFVYGRQRKGITKGDKPPPGVFALSKLLNALIDPAGFTRKCVTVRLVVFCRHLFVRCRSPPLLTILTFQNFRRTEDKPVGFNYARERRKFENEWVKLREQYQTTGFSEENIMAMRAFDEEAFRSQRRYENHSQELPSEDFGEDGSENRTNLFGKFEGLSVSFDESSFGGRYAWVDEIGDPTLTHRLKQLKESDLELLTLFAIEGYGQPDIAHLLGCSQQNISLKMTRIKKFLNKL
jgi:DNA-directed RNA polymerase specialized sigma subunit